MEASPTTISNNTTAINSRMATANTSLSNISSKANSIDTSLNTIETETASMDNKLTSTNTSLTNISKCSDTMNTSLTNISTKANTMDTSLNNIETETQSIDTKLTTTNTTLSNIETDTSNMDTSLNNIETYTSSADSKLTTTNTTLSYIQAQATLSDTKLSTVNTTLTQIETNTSNLSNIDTSINDIDTNTTSMNTHLANLNTTQATTNQHLNTIINDNIVTHTEEISKDFYFNSRINQGALPDGTYLTHYNHNTLIWNPTNLLTPESFTLVHNPAPSSTTNTTTEKYPGFKRGYYPAPTNWQQTGDQSTTTLHLDGQDEYMSDHKYITITWKRTSIESNTNVTSLFTNFYNIITGQIVVNLHSKQSDIFLSAQTTNPEQVNLVFIEDRNSSDTPTPNYIFVTDRVGIAHIRARILPDRLG